MITFLLILALVVGFYMAWSIGANDVSNAMGTAVGSGALSLRQAVAIAAVLEFCGAYFFGSHVSATVQTGIVDPEFFAPEPKIFAFGMISALVAAGLWLQVACYRGWPVSTTHSIVGAIVGFGIVAGGTEAIQWTKVSSIALSWLLTPLVGGFLAYTIFTLLRRRIFYSTSPIAAAKKLTPWLVSTVIVIQTSILLLKGLKDVRLSWGFHYTVLAALAAGIIGWVISWLLVRRVKSSVPEHEQDNDIDPRLVVALQKARKHLQRARALTRGANHLQVSETLREVDSLEHSVTAHTQQEVHREEYQIVEKIFGYLQIITASFMAFAHGANDVANAIGPLDAAIEVLQKNTVALRASTPSWVLILGGVGIIIGLATWGWRVIETIGRRITELTPTRGFSAEFGASTTIVLYSAMGMPVSTTHTLVGAVLGVGLARGLGAVNLTTIRDIFTSWVVTLPAGAGIAVVVFHVLKWCF